MPLRALDSTTSGMTLASLTLHHKELYLDHPIMLDYSSDNPEYLSPQTRVIFLRPLQILCGSDDINGIDTDIDENPDYWL